MERFSVKRCIPFHPFAVEHSSQPVAQGARELRRSRVLPVIGAEYGCWTFFLNGYRNGYQCPADFCGSF